MDISKDAGVRDAVRIAGSSAGPRVVMFSGVHGDEVSGIHALEKLFFDLYAGTRVLNRGSLMLVRANEYAMAQERRYVKHNLNRMFREDYGAEIDRSSYEFVRVQELKPLLKNCDYFFDFHSAPIAQEPFLVAEKQCVDFYSKTWNSTHHFRLEQVFRRSDRRRCRELCECAGRHIGHPRVGQSFRQRLERCGLQGRCLAAARYWRWSNPARNLRELHAIFSRCMPWSSRSPMISTMQDRCETFSL